GPGTEAGKLIQKEIAELSAKPVAELTAEQRAAIRTLGKDAEGGTVEGAERTLSDPKVAAKLTAEAQELIRTWTQLATKDARLAWCKNRAVTILKDAGIDIEIEVIDASMNPGTWGSFNPSSWTIKLDKAVLADGNASADTINEMMKTILHESRHAEQYWLMARRLYGKGWMAPQIEEALGLRLDVIGSARRTGKILDTDGTAKMIDVWLQDFETKKARDFRNFYLTEKKVWRGKRDAAEKAWLTANDPKNLKSAGERSRLLAEWQKASNMHAQMDKLYRTSGIEADAFEVEKGINVDIASEARAKQVYDDIFRQWQQLEEQWSLKLADAETELIAAQNANKPANIIKMRQTDVAEAQKILGEVKAAKPDVR
ncbi:MAG: hypothetical protein QOH57_3575, partial [Mycobacterium sp.]|nr:hypothetical protein [Mycobacterium sp.]